LGETTEPFFQIQKKKKGLWFIEPKWERRRAGFRLDMPRKEASGKNQEGKVLKKTGGGNVWRGGGLSCSGVG